jgi:hypothetical protein
VTPEETSRALPLVEPMPLADARSLVGEIARAGDLLTIAPAGGMASIPPGLGPVTQEFFEHYQRVGSKDGAFELDARGIRPSQYIEGYRSIGHYEDWDVVQLPGRDDVFVVEGSETTEAEMEWFPTVYHFVAREVSDR